MDNQKLDQININEENIFKPSLMSRIINEDMSNKVYLNPTDISYTDKLLQGGADKDINKINIVNIHDNINTNIGKRMFIHIFILFTALFLSVIITSIEPIHTAIFKENSLDNNDTTFKKRYIQILIFTLIFIIFTIVILILLYSLLYIFIGFYVSATNETDDLFLVINNTFKNIFWKFENGNMNIYFNILIFSFIILFIGYLIYFAIIKDYLNNIWFANYVINDKEEHTLPKKYLINYAFIIFNITLFLTAFYFIIAYLFPNSLNILSLTDISIRLFYYTIIITIFSIFAGLIFSSYLRKDLKKLIIYFSIFFIVSILSIFSTSFFSDI